MLTVDDSGALRRASRDRMPLKRIARELHHARNTIRTILRRAEPHPTPATRARTAPVLGPFPTLIDQILVDDEDAPPKQRHTALQVFRRLRDERGSPGGYAQVQRHRLKHRRRQRETFLPLGHLPGQRREADCGHIHVDFAEGRRLVPFLVTTWAYSNAPFVRALPFERAEAIRDGMVAAFAFFARVPKAVGWDNPKTVATLILHGRERRLHPRSAALARPSVFRPPPPQASPRPGEAGRRGDGPGRATPVRHPRAPRRRSG